ncbi:neprilysin-2-like [Copidosoma floridanum]|uniref:neprilysin-2-like n=1 Tax=Copidosoma floridanum TaxID=29053 RepID=UPI0006C9B145|nr:neprilysin-2-like [Copidosoma floridanum]
MDPTVKPCDDFYKFACGGFLRDTMIPDDRSEIDVYSMISDKLQKQLRASIEEESKPEDPRPLRLLKTYYQNCMNKTHIEEQGLDLLYQNLKELGGWPVLMNNSWVEDDWSWTESVYKLRKMGYSVNYFISIRMDTDLKNNTKRIIYLDKTALGIPRWYLARGLRNKIVKSYLEYMVDIAQILGADRDYAAEQLKESLKFEIKLANISLPSETQHNATAHYNPMTIAELSKKFPSIPWMENPKWWKRRFVLQRDLTLAFAFGLLYITNNFRNCEAIPIVAPTDAVTLLHTTKFLKETSGQETPQEAQKPLAICDSPGCVHTASSILRNMDPTVKPCDDFYKFACGGFLRDTMIPDDRSEIDVYSMISDKLQKQLRASIEEESKPEDPRPLRLLKTYYQNCMNKTHIEEQGLDLLYQNLKELGGWPVLMNNSWVEDDWSWTESVYKLRKMGYSVNYFISIRMDTDLKNNTKRIIYLDKTALGIPRWYLARGLRNKIVKSYLEYMVDIAQILGADRDYAAEQLKESLKFEIKLANISLPSETQHNATAHYNPMTIAELSKKFPSIPWMEYFNTILAPITSVTEDEVVVVKAPSFITELEKLLVQTPKQVLANYLMWRVAGSSVRYLNDEIREPLLTFSTTISGKTEREPRWKECVNLASIYFPVGMDALYVRKYFNEDTKKLAIEIFSDIRTQFIKILHTIDWMDNKTREAALEKAQSMTTYIAYPDELLDDKKLEKIYEKLEISSGSYFGSTLNLTLFGTESIFEMLRNPVNKSEWFSQNNIAVVNAFYSYNENSIQLPAGILQGAFFNDDRPKYMNYGAIGFVIGHEITHGYSGLGKQFDKNGNLVDWWEEETEKKFLQKAKCIVHQYGNYTSKEGHLKINGVITQRENIADNGGIKLAYLAYNEWVRRNGPEAHLPGLNYTGRQMFWLSTANTWCSKYRPEALKLRITHGQHSPAEFRVLGPMSNMPEFSKDFNCPLGTKMNPKDKCAVW